MSINTKHSYKLLVKKATKRRRRRQQQYHHQQQQQQKRTTSSIGSCSLKSKSKLSQKLQALKNLIPAHNGNIVKTDQLFKETADYIVLLKTRVVILQKLVEYYGNNPENENAVLL
ncbi:uncharacterized protein LOC133312142 [Gastrolobium bilobum]|uniref:uncharacterized protein LOC133312142 n=1 Tax=Gastrolobium bilobum TaxID=150636 RepID=UPI002AAFECE1|nr:uncharacterized protein LOC133312142 [Gastrolobium bilobum]